MLTSLWKITKFCHFLLLLPSLLSLLLFHSAPQRWNSIVGITRLFFKVSINSQWVSHAFQTMEQRDHVGCFHLKLISEFVLSSLIQHAYFSLFWIIFKKIFQFHMLANPKECICLQQSQFLLQFWSLLFQFSLVEDQNYSHMMSTKNSRLMSCMRKC